MQATQPGNRPILIELLFAEPYRFEFFQAVRLVLRWLEDNGLPPETALAQSISFENSLSLGFPASALESASLDQPGLPASWRVRMTPAFMGLLGVKGALPLHYTERIAAYQSTTKDESARAFVDLFSNRAVALFFVAWRKHRVELVADAGRDRFMPMLLALSGLSTACASRGPLPVATIAYYAGVLRQRPVAPVVLCRVLADIFKVPFRLEQAVGHWSDLADHEQSKLGQAGCVLGQNSLLGTRMWRPDLRARLYIGPLDAAQFERFLPKSGATAALQQMLSLFGTPTVSYEIRPVLRAADVRDAQPAGGSAPGMRLGYDAFLGGAEKAGRDRGDTAYVLAPLRPLARLKKDGDSGWRP
jgi:type VI secretion system protein ImpH